MAFPTVAEVYEPVCTYPDNQGGIDIPMPSVVAAGELLILAFTYKKGRFNLNTSASGQGWTSLFDLRQGTDARLIVWYKEASGSEGGTTLSVDTQANSTSNCVATVTRIQGWNSVESSTSGNSSSTIKCPEFTQSWGADDTLVMQVAGCADDESSVTAFDASLSDYGYQNTLTGGNNSALHAWGFFETTASSITTPGPAFTLSESEAVAKATIAIEPGSKGVSAGSDYTLSLAGGSLALTGGAVSLLAGRSLDLAAGSFSLNGGSVNTLVNRALNLSPGSFSLSGGDLSTAVARALSLEAGDFTLTGGVLDLTYTPISGPTYTLSLDAGSFNLSGGVVNPLVNRSLLLEAGSFTVAGGDVELFKLYVMDLESGTFLLTGGDVDPSYGRIITLEAGDFTLTGGSVNLNYSGAAKVVSIIGIQIA